MNFEIRRFSFFLFYKATLFWLSTCRIGMATTGTPDTAISPCPPPPISSCQSVVSKETYLMTSPSTAGCTSPRTISRTPTSAPCTRRVGGGTITALTPYPRGHTTKGVPTPHPEGSTTGSTGKAGRDMDTLLNIWPWLFHRLKIIINCIKLCSVNFHINDNLYHVPICSCNFAKH